MEYIIGNDKIWIGQVSLLKSLCPEIELILETMVQFSFSNDAYPGNHVIPHFKLESGDHEEITVALYLVNMEFLNVSCFLTLHYIYEHKTITMWNLCSRNRGKGYASKLVETSMDWSNRMYKLPLRLKVYLYNYFFHQVVSFYIKRGFGLERIERKGKVVCMIQNVASASTYESILNKCWKEVSQNTPQEQFWMTIRLNALQKNELRQA